MADKKTQRAVVVQKDRSLKVEQVEAPQVGDNEVLVKVAAAVINPSDIIYTLGQYVQYVEAPHRAGFEGSGTVIEIGKNFKGNLKVGDKVSIVTHDPKLGVYSEYISLPESSVFLMNPTISFEEGASHFINPGTVSLMVKQVLKEGHKAVIHTVGASALGKMLIRILKENDIKTINLVRRDDVKEELTQLGADYVLNMKDADFEQKLEEIAKKENATKCYDSIGGKIALTILRRMPAGSSMSIYGLLSGETTVPVDLSDLLTGKKITAFYLWHEFSLLTQEEKVKLIQSIQDRLNTTYSSKIEKVFPLEEVTKAFENSTINASIGKTILKIS